MHCPAFELLVFVVEIALCIDIPYFVQKYTTVFLENPQSQIVSKNSSVRFQCRANILPTNFSSYPQLDIMWWKDGIEIQNDTKITIQTSAVYGSQLQILDVDLDNIGTYQCVVRDGPVYNGNEPCVETSSFSKWMFLTLSLPAYLNIIGDFKDATWSQQTSIAANVNQPLLLQCNSGEIVTPPDYVEWRLNGLPLFLNNVSKVGSIIVERNLLIQKMTSIAIGNYSCIATWFVNRTVVGTTYIVTMKKDLYNGTSLITIDLPKLAISGNHYVLNCYTSPNANTAVVWLRNGTIFSNNHSLVFDTISINDSGLYTCLFDHDYSVSRSVTVDVFVPPTFLTETVQTIFLKQGAAVPTTLIHCPVTGIPVPSVMLYKNGAPLSVTSVYATNAEYGIYQCFANNSAGLSTRIIRALRENTFNAPSNIECTTIMMSGATYHVSISWMTPIYFNAPNTITYHIYYCSGQNVSNYHGTTNDTYYQIQLDAVAGKTMYVSSVYRGVYQSAPSFCQVPQPNQIPSIEWNVDCQHGIATFPSKSSCNFWKYCFNENQTLTELFWTPLTGIENKNLSSQLAGICAYGGSMTISENSFDLPVKVCSPNSSTEILSRTADLQIYLNCSNKSQVILSWRTMCPALYDITIYGICRNLSYEQKITKYANQSSIGEFVLELPSSNFICAFRAHYKYGLESSASTLLYCYYQKEVDTFLSESSNCISSPTLQASATLESALFAVFFTVLTVVVLLVAVPIILKQKLSSARLNMEVLKQVTPSNWDIALPEVGLKHTDCSSVVTHIDDLCHAATNSLSSEAINSCKDLETWRCESFDSCSNSLSDPYHLPSCDTSAYDYDTH